MATLIFETKKQTQEIQLLKVNADWLIEKLPLLKIENEKTFTLQHLKEDYEAKGFEDFELFWFNKPMNGVWKMGLLGL